MLKSYYRYIKNGNMFKHIKILTFGQTPLARGATSGERTAAFVTTQYRFSQHNRGISQKFSSPAALDLKNTTVQRRLHAMPCMCIRYNKD